MAVPTLVVFLGGIGGSPVEEMVACAQRSAALDSIDSALSTGAFKGAIVATDRPQDLPGPLPAGSTVDVDSEPFHFGSRLAGLVTSYSLESRSISGWGKRSALSSRGFLLPISLSLSGGARCRHKQPLLVRSGGLWSGECDHRCGASCER